MANGRKASFRRRNNRTRGRRSATNRRNRVNRKKVNRRRIVRKAVKKVKRLPQINHISSPPVNTYTIGYGNSVTVSSSNADGQLCSYGYASGGTSTTTMGIISAELISLFAQDIASRSITRSGDTSTQRAPKYKMWNISVPTQMVNMANSACLITGYMCVARDNIGNGTAYADPISAMGQGFSLTALDAGNAGPTNAGTYQHELTPFDSKTFVSLYKIIRVKKRLLLGGRSCFWNLTRKKPMIIDTTKYTSVAAGQTPFSGTDAILYPRGFRFWLWKFEGQIGQAGTTTTGQVGFTTPKINYLTTFKCKTQAFQAMESIVSYQYTGLGTGTVSVREPFDLDYKTSTNTT